MSAASAKVEFLRLSQRDQKLATKAAGAYREALKLRRRDFARRPDAWLAEREFEAVARVEAAAVERAGGTRSVFVRVGTPAWAAWQQWLAAAGDRRLRLQTRNMAVGADGWYFPTLFPPPGEDHDEPVAPPPIDP
jgi:hypothetical protein